MDYSTDNRGNGPAPEIKQTDAMAEPASVSKAGGYQRWTFTALSPFIFLALGFAFNWWAWAWMVIPVSAILYAGSKRNNPESNNDGS
jgi:hypothetical protein